MCVHCVSKTFVYLVQSHFHHISNFSFRGGEGTSHFGHAKSAIKNFHQITNFSFPGGRGTSNFACQICHKIFLPDFQLFISGGGGYVKLWSCQISLKIFLPDFQLLISQGGGSWVHHLTQIYLWKKNSQFQSGGVHLQVHRKSVRFTDSDWLSTAAASRQLC